MVLRIQICGPGPDVLVFAFPDRVCESLGIRHDQVFDLVVYQLGYRGGPKVSSEERRIRQELGIFGSGVKGQLCLFTC
jgi:hypothetical protein